MRSQRQSNKRIQMQWELERDQLNSQLLDSSRKIGKLDQEISDLREAKIKLARELDSAEKTLQQLRIEKEEAHSRHLETVKDIQSSSRYQIEDLQSKARELADALEKKDKSLESAISCKEKQESKLREEFKEKSERLQKQVEESQKEILKINAALEELNLKNNLLLKEKSEYESLIEELDYVRFLSNFKPLSLLPKRTHIFTKSFDFRIKDDTNRCSRLETSD